MARDEVKEDVDPGTMDPGAAVLRDLRSVRRSLTVLVIISSFVVIYFARDLMLPVLLGFLISLILSPVNRSLQRVGLPAALSATLLVAALSGALIAVIIFAGDTLSNWSRDMPAMLNELRRDLAGLTSTLEQVRDATGEVERLAADAEEPGTQRVVVDQPGLLNFAFSAAWSTGVSILVALTLALFLLASGNLFYIKLVRAFRRLSDKKRALTTIYDIERRVSHYLLTITLINAGLGVCVGLAMWAIGLDYPYVWGLAAFLLNYLPILGGLIGTILVAAYSFTSFDSFGYAIIAPITYQLLTSSEAQFVTPWLVGRRLKLNTVAVFLTVVLWAWLWGVPGALVAVPFLVVFKVLCDNIDDLKTVGAFLGGADDQAN